MTKRRPGEMTTLETRAEANEQVDRNQRYSQIIHILKAHGRGMTAKEIAVSMFNVGYTQTKDRNNSAPRLTELMEMGKVEPIGKTTCQYTGKTVTVYQLRSE